MIPPNESYLVSNTQRLKIFSRLAEYKIKSVGKIRMPKLKISLATIAFGLSALMSCNQMGKVEVKLSGPHGASRARLLKITPVVAKPGEIVSLVGASFSKSAAYKVKIPLLGGLTSEVPVTVADSSTASFEMPQGAGLGLKTAEFQASSKKSESFLIVADQPSNSLPILMDDASQICSTRQYIDRNGETKIGTKNCTGLSTDDNAKLIPGNIKSGVVISGVVGAYPSASFPLTDASSTSDLDAATFNAKIKSSASFEYWDSSGNRQSGSGDADITAGNIANGVSIFGENGSLSGGAAPNAWDLRAGVVVGSTTGLLKTDCRNGATPATYDMAGYPQAATANSGTDTITIMGHGYADNDTVRYYDDGTSIAGLSYSITYFVRNSTANTFQVSLTSGGVFINLTSNGSNVFFYRQGAGATDVWDSLDDFNGAATSIPTYPGWSAENLCLGLTTTASDPEVWLDVTTTGDGVTLSNCTTDAIHCSIKDKIAGNEWHKADTTDRNWTTALSYCDSLTYNGKTDWRLPTQKELMAAYNHGITSTVGGNWMTIGQMRLNYWSASSQADFINNAWFVEVGYGHTNSSARDSNYRVICVRP